MDQEDNQTTNHADEKKFRAQDADPMSSLEVPEPMSQADEPTIHLDAEPAGLDAAAEEPVGEGQTHVPDGGATSGSDEASPLGQDAGLPLDVSQGAPPPGEAGPTIDLDAEEAAERQPAAPPAEQTPPAVEPQVVPEKARQAARAAAEEVGASDPPQAEQYARQPAPENVYAMPGTTGRAPQAKKSLLSARLKKILVPALLGIAFAVAGYMIRPQIAGSSTPPGQDMAAQLRQTLTIAKAEAKKLKTELVETRQKLAETSQRADEVQAEAETDAGKVTAAETLIADLNQKLTKANTANEPMRQALAAAMAECTKWKDSSQKASGRADALAKNLAKEQAAHKEFESLSKKVIAAKTSLQKDLVAKQDEMMAMRRFLGVLDMGAAPPATAPAQSPPEPPITAKEIAWRMGHPTLVFDKGRDVEMCWSETRTARVRDGIVTSINAAPATRALIVRGGAKPARRMALPGPWRVGRGQAVQYVDLVAMYGRPERIAGTAGRMRAWWSVGAWARTVSVEVADGVVKRLDGRPADAATCCELVRHRAAAYANASQAVQAFCRVARSAYVRASAILGEKMKDEARHMAKDGWTLTAWRMAPYESVATWVGPNSARAGVMTVRSAVDCTWTAQDGTTNTQRRYVVITLTGPNAEPIDYAIFDPRP